MKHTRIKSKSLAKDTSTRLFHFTEDEELKMALAIKEAVEFMKNYGKGIKPDVVNRRYYFQSHEYRKGYTD